jgi:hypothetical protein
MSTLTHMSAGPGSETPSTSETAIGGHGGANIVPKDSAITKNNAASAQQSKVDRPEAAGKMSAEEAAERLYAERMEDEYAKREGGA